MELWQVSTYGVAASSDCRTISVFAAVLVSRLALLHDAAKLPCRQTAQVRKAAVLRDLLPHVLGLTTFIQQ